MAIDLNSLHRPGQVLNLNPGLTPANWEGDIESVVSLYSLTASYRGSGDAGPVLYAGDGRGVVHVHDVRSPLTEKRFQAHRKAKVRVSSCVRCAPGQARFHADKYHTRQPLWMVNLSWLSSFTPQRCVFVSSHRALCSTVVLCFPSQTATVQLNTLNTHWTQLPGVVPGREPPRRESVALHGC